MKPIGGYFELELPKGREYHKGAIRLNTGRNALEYILRVRGYTKVYLPYYVCDAVLEPLIKLNIDFQFYNIDANLSPIFDFGLLTSTQAFLYINYFGMCEHIVNRLKESVKNLIIDNSQSFFSLPHQGVDTFYSPRKFFGISDGGYLYTNSRKTMNLSCDYSASRYQHLLGRIERCPDKYYSIFQENENRLSNQPIYTMSKLTQTLLSSINYDLIAIKRIKNFQLLNSMLAGINELELIQQNQHQVPMVYPFLTHTCEIREKLIQNGIFVAQYWTDVLSKGLSKDSIEYNLASKLIPLPIDQRYSVTDIEIVGKIVSDLLK